MRSQRSNESARWGAAAAKVLAGMSLALAVLVSGVALLVNERTVVPSDDAPALHVQAETPPAALAISEREEAELALDAVASLEPTLDRPRIETGAAPTATTLVVHGRTLDARSGEALAGAEVTLRVNGVERSCGPTETWAVSDARGAYSLKLTLACTPAPTSFSCTVIGEHTTTARVERTLDARAFGFATSVTLSSGRGAHGATADGVDTRSVEADDAQAQAVHTRGVDAGDAQAQVTDLHGDVAHDTRPTQAHGSEFGRADAGGTDADRTGSDSTDARRTDPERSHADRTHADDARVARGIDLALTPSARVRGFVVDEHGRPLVGAAVVLGVTPRGAKRVEVLARTVSGERGNFEVAAEEELRGVDENTRPALSDATQSAAALFVRARGSLAMAVPTAMRARAVVDHGRIELSSGSSIEGRLTAMPRGRSQDLRIACSASWRRGATFTFDDDAEFGWDGKLLRPLVLHAGLDADGRFRFERLPRDDYRLTLELVRGYVLRQVVNASIAVTAPAAGVEVPFVGVLHHVRVVDAASGGAIDGAALFDGRERYEVPPQSSTSDLVLVAPADQAVRMSVIAPQFDDGEIVFAPGADGDARATVVKLTAPVTVPRVTLRVRDDVGRPVRQIGYTLKLVREASPLGERLVTRWSTSPDGDHVIELAPRGEYALTIEPAPGGIDDRTMLVRRNAAFMHTGTATRVDIVMNCGGRIVLDAMAKSGARPNVGIELRPRGSDELVPIEWRTLDASTAGPVFTHDALPRGSYVLRIEAPGFDAVTREVAVRANAVERVAVELRKSE